MVFFLYCCKLSVSGIGGLQWKRHLGNKVEVTVNEKDKMSVEEIHLSCAKNNITVAACRVGIDRYHIAVMQKHI